MDKKEVEQIINDNLFKIACMTDDINEEQLEQLKILYKKLKEAAKLYNIKLDKDLLEDCEDNIDDYEFILF